MINWTTSRRCSFPSSFGRMRINFNRPGPSCRTRRSAIKARKSITTRGAKDTLEQTDKTIQTVKRRRKQRHTKLKEMAKEEEEGTLGESWLDKFNGVEIVCPVCSTTVRGDQDVVNAHVDACVAHESLIIEDVRQRARGCSREIYLTAFHPEHFPPRFFLRRLRWCTLHLLIPFLYRELTH